MANYWNLPKCDTSADLRTLEQKICQSALGQIVMISPLASCGEISTEMAHSRCAPAPKISSEWRRIAFPAAAISAVQLDRTNFSECRRRIGFLRGSSRTLRRTAAAILVERKSLKWPENGEEEEEQGMNERRPPRRESHAQSRAGSQLRPLHWIRS